MNTVIPNVMIQCLKNDKKINEYNPLQGGNLHLQYIQLRTQDEIRKDDPKTRSPWYIYRRQRTIIMKGCNEGF
jgi:hypothetical protein